MKLRPIEFLLQLFAWILARLIYRVHVKGSDNIPSSGPVILVCNHVSYVDWLIVSALIARPPRFVMHYKYYDIPVVKWVLNWARVIPICSARQNPEILKRALDTISKELTQGEMICLFPEGHTTRDGEMADFKFGIEKILERNPVPVVPMALNGLWGTFFTHGKQRLPRHWMSRIELVIGSPILPSEANVQKLTDAVNQLRTK
jgi:1-acyl-sn-glycerol-3-phosphate acyltransferase